MKTSDLTHIALGTAFLCVAAQISLPYQFFLYPLHFRYLRYFLIRTNATTPKPDDSPNVHPARSSWLPVFAGGSSGLVF